MADNNDFAMGYAMGNDNSRGCGNGGYGWGGGMGEWIFGLIALGIFAGDGNGGGLFGGRNNGGNGALTRIDLSLNNLDSAVRGVQQGLCDGFYAMANNINALGMSVMQGFNGVDKSVCQLGYQTQSGFNALANQLSSCCCETQRSIDGIKYQMATDTCNVIQSTHNDTDRIIARLDAMESARKDELIAKQAAEIQALRFDKSQTAQNGYIDAVVNAAVARLQPPQPVPSYPVPAPYPYCLPVNSGYYGNGGYYGGCGNNGGCCGGNSCC